ncbi:MAG: HTTM domain-containing protein [Rubrobacteraceae bacterium]
MATRQESRHASSAREGSPLLRRARGKFAEVFGADLRSLAAFRIVLGLLVLADLALRATDFHAHYTDAGVLPRSQAIESGLIDAWEFSLYLINGEALFQALLFGLTALAAVCMLVGYRTRLSTIIVWVLVVSVQWRNPLLLNGGDTLLRLLLFWAMFLPLGAYWSVDRWRKAAPQRLSMVFLSVGTIGLLMQIAFVYIFTALLKTGDEWRVDGTALYYALNLDHLVTPFGVWMSQFPDLLKVLTFATLGLEALGPFLLFFPFFTGPVRTAMVLAFMSLHFGIWTMMEIGFFPWISAFCMVCFLPAWFWDTTGARINAAYPKFLPDVTRGFQRAATALAGVYPALRRARPSRTPGIVDPSIAGLAGGEDRATSAAQTAEMPREERAGQMGAPGGPVRLRSTPLTNLLAAFFLAYIFCWNLTTGTSFEVPDRLENVGEFFGLGQTWSMFAPAPPDEASWPVMPGTLRDGQKVDLMGVTRGDFGMYAVSWEKPEYVACVYETNHWRKYLNAVNGDEEYAEDLKLQFADYVCDEWNARHKGPEKLDALKVYSVETETPPPGRPLSEEKPYRDFLWHYRCS